MSEYTDPLNNSLIIPASDFKLGARSKWRHALLILLFAFIYQISEVVFGAVELFQIVTLLLTDDRNERLTEFSNRLANYMYVVLQFICLNSSTIPWPLDRSGNEIEIIQS